MDYDYVVKVTSYGITDTITVPTAKSVLDSFNIEASSNLLINVLPKSTALLVLLPVLNIMARSWASDRDSAPYLMSLSLGLSFSGQSLIASLYSALSIPYLAAQNIALLSYPQSAYYF